MNDCGYLVRRKAAGFEVTKWGDSSEPEADYTVRQTAKAWRCAGPSPKCRQGTCHHVKLAKIWVGKQRPGVKQMPARMMRRDGSSF